MAAELSAGSGGDQLDARIRKYQQRGLFATVAVTVILIAFNIGLVWYTASRLAEMDAALKAAQQELDTTSLKLDATSKDLTVVTEQKQSALADLGAAQAEVTRLSETKQQLQTQVAGLVKQADDVVKQVQESTNFKQHLHKLNWTQAKEMASTSDKVFRLFESILQYSKQGDRPLGFSLANDPAKGFTSPGFARFILKEMKLPSSDKDLSAFATQTGKPRTGDLILYEAGYAMFYFENPYSHDKFVVGMTPIGVVALDRDFGPGERKILKTGDLFAR